MALSLSLKGQLSRFQSLRYHQVLTAVSSSQSQLQIIVTLYHVINAKL